jgi:hypothetical protein
VGKALGKELIQGVEFHELNAGLIEYFFSRDAFESFVKHALSARIPVAIGVVQKVVLGVEKTIIDAPCITTQPVERLARANRKPQSGAHFVKEAQSIPVIIVTYWDAIVGESVNFFNFKAGTIKSPDYSPTTGST